MLNRILRFLSYQFILVTLIACGGGGGGGSNGNLTLSQSSVSFSAMEGDSTPAPEIVVGNVTGIDSGTIFVVVEVLDPDIVADVDVSISGSSGTLTIFPVSTSSLAVGVHTGSIRVNVCRDAACNRHIGGSPRTVTVQYEIEANPNLVDADGDGVPDINDAFPSDPSEWEDSDADGIGNNADPDDDNDGVLDPGDAFPFDPSESVDTDGDGIGNNADTDDDNDSFADGNDDFPLDSTEWLDTDGDGTGNNADPDDDNDTFLDPDDDFPLDPTEWLDTDGDGTGNNADTNDDNDFLSDTDDPRPLDENAPGIIYTAAPGHAITNTSNTILLSGYNFSDQDIFYLDGVEVGATVLSSSAVELNLLPASTGPSSISIAYQGHPYTSATDINIVEPTYYPYAEIYVGGNKFKGYWNPANQSLYVSNPQMQQIDKYQYTDSGWDSIHTLIGDYRSMAVSPDMKLIYGLTTTDLIELDIDTLSILETHTIPTGSRVVMSDLELDHANQALIVTDFRGSGSTPIIRFNAEKQSSDYTNVDNLSSRIYNSAIGRSGDGSFLLFGENGLSPVQPLVQYQPIANIFGEVSPTSSYSESDITRDGNYILVNNRRLFNNTFSELATLSSGTTTFGAAISPVGDFAITADFDGDLHWYDLSLAGGGGTLSPSHTVSLGSSVGVIYEMVISPDGLTLFVLGSNKIVVVPVWQITEDDIGNASPCPSSGCNGVAVAVGEIPSSPAAPADPGSDSANSPLTHISPNYVLEGESLELLLTGSGFTSDSVVKFGNDVIAGARFISDSEIRIQSPALVAGTYTVTVDGHQTGAPEFSVLQQAAITPHYWAIGGNWLELIYNPFDNVVYGFDQAGSTIYRLDLSDNSQTSTTVSGLNDLTWCAENNTLYVVTDTTLESYDSTTLASSATVAFTGGDRIECVAEGNIVITRENQHQYYFVWDSDDLTVTSSQQFAGYPSGFLRSPTVDGVSARGELVVVGESGTSAPDLALLRPQFPSQSIFNNPDNSYSKSKWRADGGLAIVNNYSVYAEFMSLVGHLNPALSLSSIVTPYGTTIFRETDSDTIEEIVLDPDDLADFTVDDTHAIVDNIGTARRMAISLDGHTVFVAGTNGISSIYVGP